MQTANILMSSKLKMRNGKVLRNRIVVPPMASSTADETGFAKAETTLHYQNLAKAGSALIFVEYTYVHPSGKSEPNQLGIYLNDHVSGLSNLANVIQASGALAGLQLTHAGAKTEAGLTGGALMGPSEVPVPVAEKTLLPPTAMSEFDIENWKSWFVNGAKRAIAAGFDVIEFHAAHGYGLNQWLSPITNHRKDKYGGNIQNRARLLIEIIELVRSKYPQVLISARIPGAEFYEGGMTPIECQFIAESLEKVGVDMLNISSGVGGWRRPPSRQGEGYLVPEAAAIQKVVTIPVIGVGGIRSASFIDQALREGAISLAAVGRAILEGPVIWKHQTLCPAADSCLS